MAILRVQVFSPAKIARTISVLNRIGFRAAGALLVFTFCALHSDLLRVLVLLVRVCCVQSLLLLPHILAHAGAFKLAQILQELLGYDLHGHKPGQHFKPVFDNHIRRTASGLAHNGLYVVAVLDHIGNGCDQRGVVKDQLGSRTEPGARLYAQWAAQNDAAEFTYTVENDAAAITGWQGGGEVLVIPDTLGGAPVVEIAAGAFADAPCKTVIFPDTLRRVQPGAFSGSAAESVTLFDNLQQISDYAFEDCTSLQTLYINAATAPVYSGSYYATFADKYDRLLSLADTQKLVLFSGSSARFGYDSAALDAALPHYEVVNMGVFAYTNALPQLELIRAQMRLGDLLLLSPEFDAAKRQFCTTNAFDDAFFCMAEADYDIVARLNLQQYSGVFSALGSYLQTRADMAARSYAVSPSDLDEDGNAVDTPSYNEYGDYVLYRPDAVDDTPIYGLPVDYTTASFPYDTYIAPANAEFDRFAADGVRVYLTYSPRNSRAVSADSTPEAVAALDAYFRENLDVVFLTPLQDSLMPGRYFYGTDNHLSTNGVTMRTAQVIDALTKQLQGEGIAP